MGVVSLFPPPPGQWLTATEMSESEQVTTDLSGKDSQLSSWFLRSAKQWSVWAGQKGDQGQVQDGQPRAI